MATKQSLSAPPPKPKARQRFTDTNRSSKKKVADTSKPVGKVPGRRSPRAGAPDGM